MNKKNITIDTEFFEDGIQATLRSNNQEQQRRLSAKQTSSDARQSRKLSHDQSINSYRYEYIPDNQYSDQVRFQPLGTYKIQSTKARKLQSANQFQDILSKIMANLFIKCWQSLKGILPQYQFLVHKESRHIEQIQMMQQALNQKKSFHEEVLNLDQHVRNAFTQAARSNQEKKRQIIQRQRKGVTLDSLQKQKLNRSKSLSKIQPQRDTNKSIEPKQVTSNIEEDSKLESSRASRKSYRQKFLEYKHRSKSREDGIKKSQTYTKFTNYNPDQRILQSIKINQNGHYSLGNLAPRHYHRKNIRSPSNIDGSKQELLKSINHLLMEREDVYQGSDYKYYINHRDNLRNVYNDNFSYKNLGNHQTKQYLKSNFQTSTNAQIRINQEEEDFQRARLLQEIVQKLNYSKLRLQEGPKNNPDELQIMRKVARLQKVILELKKSTQNSNLVNNHQEAHTRVESSRKSDGELYKRFLDQIYSIRSEIHQIKSQRDHSQPVSYPGQASSYPLQAPSIVTVDNNLSHIINQQQKLLMNYQTQFQKLLHQKQQTNQLKAQSATSGIRQEPSNPNFLQALLQKGQAQQNKVSWKQSQEVNKEQTKFNGQSGMKFHRQQEGKYYGQQEIKFNEQQEMRFRKSRKNKYRDQDNQVYRYTRNQILQDVGFRNQVEQQQRILRQTYTRQKIDEQKRKGQIRGMAERVKVDRQNHSVDQTIQKNRPIRQRYQQEWQKFQKTRIDVHQTDDNCCVLFPC